MSCEEKIEKYRQEEGQLVNAIQQGQAQLQNWSRRLDMVRGALEVLTADDQEKEEKEEKNESSG